MSGICAQLPAGWDAADALVAGWDAEMVARRARWVAFSIAPPRGWRRFTAG